MLTLRDQHRLVGVHPDLVKKLTAVLTKMDLAKHPMFVVMGVRTAAEQAALWAKGRTLPGTIVTYKDGLHKKSNHQPKADGFGHAVDCAFAGVLDPFAGSLPWDDYGRLCEAEGLVWGGHWTTLVDRPHVELP